MAAPSNDDLKREAEAVLGITLDDDEIEVSKGRLPTLLENVRLLAGWAGQLESMGPAQVLDVVEAPTRKASADD